MKFIPLTKGFKAIVDDCDYEKVSKFKWRALVCDRAVYAQSRIKINNKTQNLLMHRFILGLKPDKFIEVDHINNDGVDNRNINLRLCTSQQNKFNGRKRKNNKSGYKGVCWYSKRNRWISQIQINKKNIMIGRFKDKVEAAKAYDKKSRELFGEFAKPNFVEVS